MIDQLPGVVGSLDELVSAKAKFSTVDGNQVERPLS